MRTMNKTKAFIACALAVAALAVAGSAALAPVRLLPIGTARAASVVSELPRDDASGLLRDQPREHRGSDRDDVHGILCAWAYDPSSHGANVRVAIVPEEPVEYPHAFQGLRLVHAAVLRVTPVIGRAWEMPLTLVGPGRLATEVPIGWLSLGAGARLEVLGWEEGADVTDDAAAIYSLRSVLTLFP